MVKTEIYCVGCLVHKYISLSLQLVRDRVKESGIPARTLVTTAYKKNRGRIFGGQFLDGISNAVDVISMMRYIILCTVRVRYCTWISSDHELSTLY